MKANLATLLLLLVSVVAVSSRPQGSGTLGLGNTQLSQTSQLEIPLTSQVQLPETPQLQVIQTPQFQVPQMQQMQFPQVLQIPQWETPQVPQLPQVPVPPEHLRENAGYNCYGDA
ncbi:unnamed protein product [Enterobius vermicularis]|uniref:Low molecular weight glutenin subunit n=1 Tax=Enterobius vermicularis TaxID=51028 RepID=A0A0N4VGS8_ENTVE|nr:unnamed protein product [Enterobius vermicularis]